MPSSVAAPPSYAPRKQIVKGYTYPQVVLLGRVVCVRPSECRHFSAAEVRRPAGVLQHLEKRRPATREERTEEKMQTAAKEGASERGDEAKKMPHPHRFEGPQPQHPETLKPFPSSPTTLSRTFPIHS